MKKALFTTVLSLSLTPLAMAHPGHDHTYSPAGELHHLLWIGLGVVAVLGLGAWMIRRSRRGR